MKSSPFAELLDDNSFGAATRSGVASAVPVEVLCQDLPGNLLLAGNAVTAPQGLRDEIPRILACDRWQLGEATCPGKLGFDFAQNSM